MFVLQLLVYQDVKMVEGVWREKPVDAQPFSREFIVKSSLLKTFWKALNFEKGPIESSEEWCYRNYQINRIWMGLLAWIQDPLQ